MKTAQTLIYFRGFAFALAMVSTLLSGCPGTRQVYDLAKTPDEYAKAALSHHNALGEAAIAMRADPLVSEATKTALRIAYRKTVCSSEELAASKPTADCASGPSQHLQDASDAYAAIRSPSTEAELQRAVDTLTAILIDLIELTGGNR